LVAPAPMWAGALAAGALIDTAVLQRLFRTHLPTPLTFLWRLLAARRQAVAEKTALLPQSRPRRFPIVSTAIAFCGLVLSRLPCLGRNRRRSAGKRSIVGEATVMNPHCGTAQMVVVGGLMDVVHQANEAGVAEADLSEAELQRRRLLNEILAKAAENPNTSIAELRFAVAQAREVGLNTSEYSELEKRLKREEEKEKDAKEQLKRKQEKEQLMRKEAQDRILAEVWSVVDKARGTNQRCAMALGAVLSRLTDLIHRAKEAGVAEADLSEAKLQRHRLLNEIVAEAVENPNASIADLRFAVARAQEVGLDASKYSELERRLKREEDKERVLAEVRSIVDEATRANRQRTMAMVLGRLTDAVRRAKETGVAEADLHEAELRHVRLIKEFVAKVAENLSTSITELRLAVAQAQEVGIDASIYSELEERLKREEEKECLLARVGSIVDEATRTDRLCAMALKMILGRLTDAIHVAKEAGVAEKDLHEAELQRRRLHNDIADLKGAIRVYCRVRPLMGGASSRNEALSVVDNMTLAIGEKKVNFNAVFEPGTQDEVFEECRGLVQSAIDGYNVTIFAYGQTGAGKTFTMYGTPEAPGIAPRTIREIYLAIDQHKKRFKFTVKASMTELYKNELADVFARSSRLPMERIGIRTDKAGNVQISNLHEEECSDSQALIKLLLRGLHVCKVSGTDMNSRSSRSHVMLMLKIESENLETHEKLEGKILLCDLAGAERTKKSGATGDRQQEAIEVNKSLTALNRVIKALVSGDRHIPYKDHKLTALLQDSVGGTAKTLMFVNCSPAQADKDETVQSLEYATWAMSIHNCDSAPGAGTKTCSSVSSTACSTQASPRQSPRAL